MTPLNQLKPGDLFKVDIQGRVLFCLWAYSHLQLATPDDTRILVDVGFTHFGKQQQMQVERLSWHDCNSVYVVL